MAHHNRGTSVISTTMCTLMAVLMVALCCCCGTTLADRKCSSSSSSNNHNYHNHNHHNHHEPRSLSASSMIPFHHSHHSPLSNQKKHQHSNDDLIESASDLNSIVAAAIAAAVDSAVVTSNPPSMMMNNKQKRSQNPSITTMNTTITTPSSSLISSTITPPMLDNSLSSQSINQHGQNFAPHDNLLMDNNSNFMDNGGDYALPFYSNYYLPPSAATGSLYPVDLGNLLSSPNYQSNPMMINMKNGMTNINNNNNKNKTIGLGRRIGELVSTSAEKATRAFKSFPKLLNDIKPSKLLGLSSSPGDSIDFSTPKHNISSIPLPSSWYLPQNTWSSFAPPPLSSSLFLQQPVFIRTQDMGGSSSPMQTTNQILSPSASTLKSDYHSNRMASSPSGQQNVYPNDLYASAQTSYGNRVKPPSQRDQYADFDNSGEDHDGINVDPDQDTKMANDGSIMDSDNNNSGQHNDHIMANDMAANNGWQHSGSNSQPYEDYGEQSTNNDFYPNHHHHHMNHNSHNHNRNNNNNVFAAGNMRRPPFPTNFRSAPTSSFIRNRPLSMSDADMDNWYPAFFGPNVKPMTRLRNFPNHYSAANSLLNPTTANEYMPFMRATETPATLAAHSHFYPISTSPLMNAGTAVRPTSWPALGYYPGLNPLYNYPHRANSMMATAGSMIRPMTIPFFPPINQFYMQRYRSLPYMAPYTSGGYHPTTAATMPYRSYGHQSPFNSLVTAASSLYPVRIPFSAISTPLSYHGPLMATPFQTQIPVLRHRIGPLMMRPSSSSSSSSKPSMAITTKRQDNSTNKYSEYAVKLNSTEVAKTNDLLALNDEHDTVSNNNQTHRMMRSYRHYHAFHDVRDKPSDNAYSQQPQPKQSSSPNMQTNNEWRPVFVDNTHH